VEVVPVHTYIFGRQSCSSECWRNLIVVSGLTCYVTPTRIFVLIYAIFIILYTIILTYQYRHIDAADSPREFYGIYKYFSTHSKFE
jgi:hypothetical protein